MAPVLNAEIRNQILAMLEKGFSTQDIVSATLCSARTVQRYQRERERPESEMPRRRARPGRRSRITPDMKKYLCDKITDDPELHVEEMVQLLREKFDVKISHSALGRALKDWPRKKMRRIAQQRDEDLRDYYLYTLAKLQIESFHIVYFDESGCDTQVCHRRSGRAPKGKTPIKYNKLKRGRRWQILPAFTQNGVLMYRVYQGPTDKFLIEDFMSELLHFCEPFPGRNSVIIRDNASVHRSLKIKKMCDEAGVLYVELSPYSPDFNPIEEYFSNLKTFIKKAYRENHQAAEYDFGFFLKWCVEVVGDDDELAKRLFHHAGIPITYPE
ncbi:hypothetical protein ACQRIU_005949 [Beauveria bassiana]